jgi:hypothetical protein
MPQNDQATSRVQAPETKNPGTTTLSSFRKFLPLAEAPPALSISKTAEPRLRAEIAELGDTRETVTTVAVYAAHL